MVSDSSIFEPRSAAYLMNLFVGIGASNSWDEFEDWAAGSRNGRLPVGDA